VFDFLITKKERTSHGEGEKKIETIHSRVIDSVEFNKFSSFNNIYIKIKLF